MACIMKVISNCNKKWDSVLFICCPGCVCPRGETGRHPCQNLKQSKLVHKTWSKLYQWEDNLLPGIFKWCWQGQYLQQVSYCFYLFGVIKLGWGAFRYNEHLLQCSIATILDEKKKGESIWFVISTLPSLSDFLPNINISHKKKVVFFFIYISAASILMGLYKSLPWKLSNHHRKQVDGSIKDSYSRSNCRRDWRLKIIS